MKILVCGQPQYTKKYASAIINCGHICDCTPDADDFSIYDGLVLPGGGDIDPHRFGEVNNGSIAIDNELDEKQFRALAYFVNEKKPILGICKGMQIINVFLGGTLIQHLPTADRHRDNKGGKSIHTAFSTDGSAVQRLYGRKFAVNSYHHQGCAICGNGLFYTAFSDDNVPEALEHISLPIFGAQWHPERDSFEFRVPEICDGEILIKDFLNGYGKLVR